MNSLHLETRPTLKAAPARPPLRKLHLNKEALRVLTGSEKRTTNVTLKAGFSDNIFCFSHLNCTVTL